MRDIRVRFAPSPTGPLHIGGLRTALFNYFFARGKGGKFILRIEDTDQTRFVPGAEQYIQEALSWCGIEIDEGPMQGGAFGPYRQSERKEMYSGYADKLIASGRAYYAFDTPEELALKRAEYESRKETFTYDSSSREAMRNSLSLSASEIKALIEAGVPFVIRFRFDPEGEILTNDIIRGEVRVKSSALDDKILFKSDGMPTYHLANVVDDYKMQISHVIRGEEWLPSYPLHVALYEAFGWQNEMPEFAHLPLILKPNGKGKLSKRDGDKGGFPVFPLNWKDPVSGEVAMGYREAGYFPEACINILAFMGWNPGTEEEFFSMDELITVFELDRVTKSGAKFDPDKATWYNHKYLQKKSDDEILELFRPVLQARNVEMEDENLLKIIAQLKERVNFISEIWDDWSFFFKAPESYDEKIIKKQWKEHTPDQMKEIAALVSQVEIFESAELERVIKEKIQTREWGMGAIMNALRLLLVGESKGPSLFEICEIIGKEEVLKRIEKGIAALAK